VEIHLFFLLKKENVIWNPYFSGIDNPNMAMGQKLVPLVNLKIACK